MKTYKAIRKGNSAFFKPFLCRRLRFVLRKNVLKKAKIKMYSFPNFRRIRGEIPEVCTVISEPMFKKLMENWLLNFFLV